MTINKTRIPQNTELASSHLNFMGGRSWDVSNPLTRLRMAAASCFFGEPQYYIGEAPKRSRTPRVHFDSLSAADRKYLRDTLEAMDPSDWRGLSPQQIMERTIDEALNFDPRGTLEVAAALRNEDLIRVTPQVIMVRAANHAKVRGTTLIREFAPRIVRRLDETSTQLAYQFQAYGVKAPIPNSLKRAWRTTLERTDEKFLAKYKQESREVKLVDVVNLVHPASDAVNKLVRGTLKLSDETWEAIISREGSTPVAWSKAIDVMGHMALLRNVRNLVDKGADQTVIAEKLVAGAPTGKQLPFRYVSAYKALEGHKAAPQLVDAIETSLLLSIDALPRFVGRTMSLCDNSGSAWGTTTSELGTVRIAEIANLTGVIAGLASDEGYVGRFGDKLSVTPVRKRASVMDQVAALNRLEHTDVGGSTEHGIWLFLDQAIRLKEHWDTIFVFSDMQAGHGGLYGTHVPSSAVWGARGGAYIDVAKLVRKYRAEVNPNVDVFLVQVAGYEDTIVPEYYNRTYILGGWGPGLLRFAAAMKRPTQ